MTYRVRTMGSLGGAILPTYVNESDVHALKVRLNPYVQSLAADVARCSGIPDNVRQSFQLWASSWAQYFNEEEGFFTSAAEMDQGETYEKDLQAWQQRIASGGYGCNPSAPTPGLTGAADDSTHTTIRVVAAAAIIIALVVGVRTVMKK